MFPKLKKNYNNYKKIIKIKIYYKNKNKFQIKKVKITKIILGRLH